MNDAAFRAELEKAVFAQLRSRKVAYLLGAGSSYLSGAGYPLAAQLWDHIRSELDVTTRAAVQGELDKGAVGIEQALDRLDDGARADAPHRRAVTDAIASRFRTLQPSADIHRTFVRRIAARSDPEIRIFSLNYDPLVERAADIECVRLTDGFSGIASAFFDPSSFDERPWFERKFHKHAQAFRAKRPVQLFKLHGSLGWYETEPGNARRISFGLPAPDGTRSLMVPPQRRKASDTMLAPYAALWSRFRGALAHDVAPINRLVSIGYGFGDHHVNECIRPALQRSDFTLLIFTKALSDASWDEWSSGKNAIVVTESRCALFGVIGLGHSDLWSFERLAGEA